MQAPCSPSTTWSGRRRGRRTLQPDHASVNTASASTWRYGPESVETRSITCNTRMPGSQRWLLTPPTFALIPVQTTSELLNLHDKEGTLLRPRHSRGVLRTPASLPPRNRTGCYLENLTGDYHRF